MAYGEHTAMSDLLHGMAAVEAEACHEFARRQFAGGHGESLRTAAARLHDTAFAIQLDRPADLHAWKYPERFDPIAVDLLKQVLQAASEDDTAAVREALADASFATVTALSSIATHLRQSSEQIARFGFQQPDPQQTLF